MPALLGIEGVGSVDLTGGEEQRITITLDPDKLAENGDHASARSRASSRPTT